MSKPLPFISQKVSFPVEGVEATRRLRVSGANPDMSAESIAQRVKTEIQHQSNRPEDIFEQEMKRNNSRKLVRQ